jgi:hypothetical protein
MLGHHYGQAGQQWGYLFTDRPGFASNPNQPGVMVTPFGIFNPTPVSGAVIIPHNDGKGSSFATVNLRLSRTSGFGETRWRWEIRTRTKCSRAVRGGSKLF